MQSLRMSEPAGTALSTTFDSLVLVFNRVTMRQPAASSLAHQP